MRKSMRQSMKKKALVLITAFTVMMAMSFSAMPTFAADTPSGTAITSAADFVKIEANPSGSYYLANDIDLGGDVNICTTTAKQFTGTFDGNGHAITGYAVSSPKTSHTGIFGYAKGAKFKNLKITGINVKISDDYQYYGTILSYGNGCTFSGITVTGNINVTISGTESSANIGGIAGLVYDSKYISCKNSANITVSVSGTTSSGVEVAGINTGGSSYSKCTNTGKLTVTGSNLGFSTDTIAAYGIGKSGSFTNCKNAGAISATAGGKSGSYLTEGLFAAGIGGSTTSATDKVVSCGNTGKISLKATDAIYNSAAASGLISGFARTVSKCYNKGAVTYSTKGANVEGSYASGICGAGGTISQSYNKGNITATHTGNEIHVGGISGDLNDMSNCYNVGKVVLNGHGYVGGISGYAYGKATCNYATGKVSGTAKPAKGTIFGYNTNNYVKHTIYNNYYTTGKAYGASDVTWKDWKALAKKVSSIKKSTCPKLSSKYWKYSSKYKRMILKNNQE